MARKRNEARSISTEGVAGTPVKHRRTTRTTVAPQPEAQPEPEPVLSETATLDAVAKPAASARKLTTDSASEREEIARIAYSYWEARGRQHGSDEEDWIRAEQEFRRRRSA